MWQAQNKRRSIVKRGLKKNQVMIAALAVMIAAAGYLNYTGRLFGTEKDDTTQTSADLTNQELLDISEEDTATGSEDILSNDSETEGTPGEAVLTNTTAETTVAQAKVSREQVMAQSKETLQSIIDNKNLSDEQKHFTLFGDHFGRSLLQCTDHIGEVRNLTYFRKMIRPFIT